MDLILLANISSKELSLPVYQHAVMLTGTTQLFNLLSDRKAIKTGRKRETYVCVLLRTEKLVRHGGISSQN